MSANNASQTDELLLQDLVAGLSLPGDDPTLSVGIVGSESHPAQPPAHCLRACLDQDPRAIEPKGCPFLQAAAQDRIEDHLLRDGRCAKGFQVAAQPTAVGGRPAVLLTVEGQAVPEPVPRGRDSVTRHLDAASRVVQRVSQLLEENAGFADEVLQNYEQLNLIFDFTQQIAQVTDTREIEKLLMRRVGSLVAAETVSLVTHDGTTRTYNVSEGVNKTWIPGPVVDPAEMASSIETVRKTRQVHVAVIGSRKIIAAPLVRLDDQVDVVFAVGQSPAGAPTSGDMMLIESVLTFGGQMLSNSELHERLRRMSLEVTRALVAAIDKKDHYTSGHSERGGFLTRLTAREMGLSTAEQQIMEWAGLLHDVGKIGIPEEILCKPGKLTKEEFEVIKQHPRMGYEILQPIASLGVVLDGVLYHHEYPDGSGYPEGLKGDEIPLVARIIHVVDTFDALTSTRSYRKAFTIEKAMQIIREERGVRIDTEAADAFFSAFERYRSEEPDDFAIRFPAVQDEEVAHERS